MQRKFFIFSCRGTIFGQDKVNILRSMPAKFQSCATFVVGFFSIEVCSTTINGRFSTVTCVLWQAPKTLLLLLWIFVACPLSHRFRSAEFDRSCARSCKLGSLLCLSPASWVRHNFAMASCSELSSKVKEQLFRLTVCRLIFPVRGVCVLGEKFCSSVSVGDRVVVRLSSQQLATRWRFSTKFSGATRASSESSISSVEPVETERWRRRSSPPSWTASLELCQVCACLANLKQAVRPSPPVAKLDAFDVRASQRSLYPYRFPHWPRWLQKNLFLVVGRLLLVVYTPAPEYPKRTRAGLWDDLHSDPQKSVFLTSAVSVTSFRPITFYVIFLSSFSSVWNKIIKFWQRQVKFQCIT